MHTAVSIITLLTARLSGLRTPVLLLAGLLMLMAALAMAWAVIDVMADPAGTFTAAPFRWRAGQGRLL